MTTPENRKRALRLLALGAIIGLGAYWLGTHYGQRTPGSVAALQTSSSSGLIDAIEEENVRIYRQASPAVANIVTRAVQYDFFFNAVPIEGAGSGFVIDADGHILTNYHVVRGANRGVEVQLANKRKYAAKVVGVDKVHDLALLQIAAPDLQPVTLADSSGLQVGQKVYAIGNPFGLSGTMTRGIISSIRSIKNEDDAPIEDAIQTDAAINPGNSGGPLLNSRGEVIGINTMIASNGADQSSGIGFAIPINTAKAVLADLTKFGQVRRPSLGIQTYAIGPDLASQMGLAADYGVLIQRVIPGGAAERAGLHGGDQQAYVGNTPIMLGGDLIVAIDGQQVADQQDISAIMDKHQAGDVVSVTILRGRRQITLKLILGEAHEANT